MQQVANGKESAPEIKMGFDNFVTGIDTWVNLYESMRKANNRGSKTAKR